MPTDPRISGGVSGRTEGSTRNLTARTSPIRGTGQAAAEPPPDHRLRSTDPRAPVDPALLESAVKEASEGTISPSDSATSSPRGPLHGASEPPAPAAAGTDEHDASLDAALAALLDQLKERVTNISDSQLAYVTHFFEGLDSRHRDKWATTLLSFAHLIEGADSTAAPLSGGGGPPPMQPPLNPKELRRLEAQHARDMQRQMFAPGGWNPSGPGVHQGPYGPPGR